jgi:hypothetical protein
MKVRVDERATWVAALTLAHNIAVDESDRRNNNDESEACDACAEVARRIRPWTDANERQRAEMVAECGVVPNEPPRRFLKISEMVRIIESCRAHVKDSAWSQDAATSIHQAIFGAAALRGRGEEVVVAEGPVDYIGRSVYMMVDGGAHTETEFHRNAAEVIRALVEDGQRVQVVLRKIGDGEVGS